MQPRDCKIFGGVFVIVLNELNTRVVGKGKCSALGQSIKTKKKTLYPKSEFQCIKEYRFVTNVIDSILSQITVFQKSFM